MSITPFVYPPVDQSGTELEPIIYAIFDFSVESGAISKENCFLIRKVSNYKNDAVEPITTSVSEKRLELASDAVYATPDYGDDPNSGELYRSQIIITPSHPLKQHAEYSVVLSGDISAVSVFDLKPSESNVSKFPIVKGPFLGLTEDLYTITITASGDEKSVRYSWSRSSDSHEELDIAGRKRYIEVDRGMFIKFPRGTYTENDTFTVKVIPEQKINQTYAWNFSTGDNSYSTPEDEKSSTIIELPINTPATGTTSSFALVSTTPYEGETMMHPGSKGMAVVNGIVFETKDKTDALNSKIIKFIPGAALTVYELNNDIVFEIIEETTTHQDIIDVLALSVLSLVATSSLPTTVATIHESGVTIVGGVPIAKVVLEFSQNIDPASVTSESIKLLGESLLTTQKGSVDFTHEIIDNRIEIQLL